MPASQPSLRLFLDRLTIRSALSEVEQHAILGLPATTILVAAHRDFVRLGESVNHASLIADGLVARFDQNALGGRQITALHIGGDMPDLQTVAYPDARCALQTLSAATVIRIPYTALREVSQTHPGIANAFWRESVADSMVLATWLLNVGRKNSLGRVAHLFCEMAYRYGIGDGQNQVTYRLHMTQNQMADATGMTPVHINRTLQALKHSGTTFRRGIVQIANWDKLVRIADFDSGYLQVPPHLS